MTAPRYGLLLETLAAQAISGHEERKSVASVNVVPGNGKAKADPRRVLTVGQSINAQLGLMLDGSRQYPNRFGVDRNSSDVSMPKPELDIYAREELATLRLVARDLRAVGFPAPEELTLVVPGEPVPKGRPRALIRQGESGKPFAQIYTPVETRAFEKRVATAAQFAVNRAGWTWGEKDRFTLHVEVYRTYEGKGGDLDNYIKAVQDALNKIAYPDDGRIRSLTGELAQDTMQPRVFVRVRKVCKK